ncbi:dimethyl sulfoxide reductase anchor subunit family protein [Dokdonella soli]|uniref:Dimethyl sulfoxide reductase anchor subunit n=1 Tax=Dokdonella soli TaxID=529810 RepID=A0ABP3TUU8_9GAMM
MRPTFSIILFTVLSGAGYGLWFLIGLALTTLWPHCGPSQRGGSFTFCVYPAALPCGLIVGFALVSAGLLSSLGHLGQPRRAWRALSQWRSSWLSREGVASILTYAPALALIVIEGMRLRSAMQPADLSAPAAGMNLDGWNLALGALLAVGSAATVFCTAHIYASLMPIRAWHNRYVVPGYLLLGLYGGALCLWVLETLPGTWRMRETPGLLVGLVVVATASALLKVFYWRQIDRAPTVSAGHAIGLESLGSVRSFEQPHTEENYLTHEMGFVLARKHSRKLRAIALLAGFLVPALLALLGLAMPATRFAAGWLALVSGMTGVFVERWLFFAEAKHAVMAYYGR